MRAADELDGFLGPDSRLNDDARRMHTTSSLTEANEQRSPPFQ